MQVTEMINGLKNTAIGQSAYSGAQLAANESMNTNMTLLVVVTFA